MQDLPRPLLVYAHPGSGTHFVQDELRHAGFEHVHHEHRKPGSALDAMITYRALALSADRYATKVHLIRDPFRTVFSALGALQNRPSVAPSLIEQVIFNGLHSGRTNELAKRILRDWPSLVLLMETVLEHERRAKAAGLHTFRLEDIPCRSGHTPKSHIEQKGITPSWMALDGLDARRALALRTLCQKYGYEA